MPLGRRAFIHVAALLAALSLCGPASAAGRYITVASTTSTENSGLFGHLRPLFTAKTGIQVRVVAVGTGQALKLARNGDADVLFVHHRPSEEQFVREGYGVRRYDVMYNDFVLLGPAADPAGVRGLDDISAALARIAGDSSVFVSRGDDSGTHKKELSLWDSAKVDVAASSGRWYRETGSGMGATLNTASAMDGYVLSDRASWLSFTNRGRLEIVVEGDPRLFNPYGVILVNPQRHPHVKADDGQAFVDWLVSAEGQAAIGAYRLQGRQAFFPDAGGAKTASR